MGEDLIIGDNGGPIKEDDVVWDETTPVEYLNAAVTAYANLVEIDTEVLQPVEKKRILQMRKWSLRIAHYYLKDIYTDLFDPKEEINEQ